MALSNKSTFIARSASLLSHFVPLVSPPKRCPSCLRTFSSSMWCRQPTRRHVQTAAAYQPTTLFPGSPPPNTGALQIPTAGPAPGANKATGSSLSSDDLVNASGDMEARAGVSGGEAQLAQMPDPKKSPRLRHYKFGPRKATIKLSPAAVAHLRELLELPEPKLIRIGTKAKGCSGLAYHLEYVDKPSALDEQVEQDGVRVLIDNKALLNIIGSEMDWLEDRLNERFIFKNPNITEQCGCGESFSVS